MEKNGTKNNFWLWIFYTNFHSEVLMRLNSDTFILIDLKNINTVQVPVHWV